MPAKRRKTASAAVPTPATPKARQSKLARENDISAQEEAEIKEAFALFSEPLDGEKEGALPISDVRKAMIAIGIPPSAGELSDFVSILDPESEGYASYASFVAICALKMRAKDDGDDARNEEVEEAFHLFTGGVEGPIALHHLKRVAASLKEDIDEETLKNMILEANGGAGVGKGVGKEEFEAVMKRAGVWK